MSSERTIAELEGNIEEFQARIKQQDKLVKLQENPEFKELIADGFLKDEAVRLTMLRGSGYADAELKESCLAGIDAIGWLNSMLAAIHQLGNEARYKLPETEAALTAIMSGEYDEDLDGDGE